MIKKTGISIAFKSIAGIVLLLVLFSSIICILGYRGVTAPLLEQHADDAYHAAETAALFVDPERMDEYMESGGETEEYRSIRETLDRICDSTGSTFIYVITPDRTDYSHITFWFSSMNSDIHFTKYDFGYVRETTNDDYRNKYRELCENGSDRELVVRDEGNIETEHHITAMIPLRTGSGETAALMCVQMQMEGLAAARTSYLIQVIRVMFLLGLLLVAMQSLYLHSVVLLPLKQISAEAGRFATENVPSERKLTETVKNRDEIGMLASSIDEMEEKIQAYVTDLTRITAEKERISTDLELARRIQADMLPNEFPAFPDRREFDIFASMDPAREVGGDFYDFYLIDDDHLCIAIADVSGKGVPAALFMMASKILLANMTMQGKSPKDVLRDTNETICRKNREEMFVTVWLGILEISTGRLRAANAGHEYPMVKEPDGNFVLYRDVHGFVIGGMENIRYREYELTLRPGSKLFLYTDGVPEATDTGGKMFGTGRMLETLNAQPEASPEELIGQMRGAADVFARDAEQFDDMTMVCLEYRGAVSGGQQEGE